MRELKSYKAPPQVRPLWILQPIPYAQFLAFSLQAKDAHVGAVKNYSAPSAPKPPTVPADLAAELSKYDAEEPDLADSPAKSASSTEEAHNGGAKEFLAFLEQDLPKKEAHHH